MRVNIAKLVMADRLYIDSIYCKADEEIESTTRSCLRLIAIQVREHLQNETRRVL
jgi:predicted GNAT superfamily acetyltransferase